MDNPSLREKLEQLHAELERTQEIDESNSEYLQHLIVDIQSVLNQSGVEQSRKYPLITERLRDAIKRLEDSHPKLTLAIGQVLDHLAQV